MLGPLAFVAVREQHDDAGEQVPFGFTGGDELVDDDLGAVGEVAELGLPQDEGLGVVAGVSVLEAEDGGFREHGVVDVEAGLVGPDVGEWNEAGLGLGVDEDGVALVEGAALGVLAGEADGRAVGEERGEGHQFGHAVVEGAVAGRHFSALLEELFDLRVDVEAGRILGGGGAQFGDARGRQAGGGVVAGVEVAAAVLVPVVGELGEVGAFGPGGGLLVFEELVLDFGDFGGGVYVDFLGVELEERGMVFDEGVAARLGDGGVVDFAVAVAAVADEIDDDVGVEGMAVVGGDAGHAQDSVGVFGVDVEDGDGGVAWRCRWRSARNWILPGAR